MNGAAVIHRPRIEAAPIVDFLHKTAATPNFSGGARHIYKMELGQNPQLLAFYRQKQEQIADIASRVYFSSNTPYYTTKNSFFADIRRNDTLFSLDNIVVDVDNHANGSARERDYEVQRLLFALDNDYEGKMPPYNYTKTGRGVHLWLPLQSFSSKLALNYKLAAKGISDIVTACIQNNNIALEVDTGNSLNASALVRLPFTYNASSRTYSEYIHRTDERLSLDELQEIGALYIEAPTATARTECASTDWQEYAPLHRKRINFIEELIKQGRIQQGRRRYTLFMLYNSTVQLTQSTEAAAAAIHKANAQLDEPLQEAELESIARYISNRRGYRSQVIGLDYKKVDFLCFLECDVTERLMYQNMPTAKEREREAKREAKHERNARIQELKRRGYTQAEVSAEIQCSLRTVKTYWHE